MPSPVLRGLNIHSTIGAVFIGFATACGVYGIFATQVFYYFWRYPADSTLFKCLVVFILILETTDQAFIGHLLYHYTISNYLNPQALLRATTTWSLIMQMAIGAIVGAIVKCYFAFRVWRFSKRNIYITGFLLLLIVGQLGLATAFTIKAFQLPSIFAVHNIQTLGTISLGVGVLTDVSTSGALCFYLNRLRTGYQSSDTLINSLCKYAINTGALTSTLSASTLLLYNLSQTNNLYFVATHFILSKLYSISFMTTLNTRREVRGRGTDRQGATSNNTNLFHLGTRMPSMAGVQLESWDKSYQSPQSSQSPQRIPLDTFPYSGKYQQGPNVGVAF